MGHLGMRMGHPDEDGAPRDRDRDGTPRDTDRAPRDQDPARDTQGLGPGWAGDIQKPVQGWDTQGWVGDTQGPGPGKGHT